MKVIQRLETDSGQFSEEYKRALRDTRISELKPAELLDAKELWVRDNILAFQDPIQPHIRDLLAQIDAIRAEYSITTAVDVAQLQPLASQLNACTDSFERYDPVLQHKD